MPLITQALGNDVGEAFLYLSVRLAVFLVAFKYTIVYFQGKGYERGIIPHPEILGENIVLGKGYE